MLKWCSLRLFGLLFVVFHPIAKCSCACRTRTSSTVCKTIYRIVGINGQRNFACQLKSIESWIGIHDPHFTTDILRLLLHNLHIKGSLMHT